MSKQFAGIRRILITEHTSTTGDTVELRNVSSDSTITHENIEVESTTGAKYGGQTWTIEATDFSTNMQATIDTLRSWSENDKRVIMCIEMIDGVVVWNEPTNLGSTQFQFTVNARDGLDRIYMKAMVLGAYPFVVYAKNIIKAIAKYTTLKKPVTGVYTPVTQTTGLDDKWSNKGTTHIRGAGEPDMEVRVFFPLYDSSLTFTAEKDADTTRSVLIYYYNVGGGVLGSDSLDLNGTSGERASVDITLPTGIYSMGIRFSGNTNYDEITLRNDGNSNFINY